MFRMRGVGNYYAKVVLTQVGSGSRSSVITVSGTTLSTVLTSVITP